jgi:uncharacterized protein
MLSGGHLDLTLMLLLGMASSLHCASMCGPLIVVASAHLGGGTVPPISRLLAWQAVYHAGRGITYGVSGALLAWAGGVLTSLGRGRTLGGILQISLGLGLLVLAILQLARRRGVPASSGAQGAAGLLASLLRRLVTSGRGAGMLALGLLTGLLPCGVLYAALARSVAASSALEGSALMLAFWLGTVPLLGLMGLASSRLFRVAGRLAPTLLFLAMALTGGHLTFRGVRTLSSPRTAAVHARADHLPPGSPPPIHRGGPGGS